MNNVNEISDSMLEQAIRMETILTDAATGRSREEEMYIHLRRKFLADKELEKTAAAICSHPPKPRYILAFHQG